MLQASLSLLTLYLGLQCTMPCYDCHAHLEETEEKVIVCHFRLLVLELRRGTLSCFYYFILYSSTSRDGGVVWPTATDAEQKE